MKLKIGKRRGNTVRDRNRTREENEDEKRERERAGREGGGRKIEGEGNL